MKTTSKSLGLALRLAFLGAPLLLPRGAFGGTYVFTNADGSAKWWPRPSVGLGGNASNWGGGSPWDGDVAKIDDGLPVTYLESMPANVTLAELWIVQQSALNGGWPLNATDEFVGRDDANGNDIGTRSQAGSDVVKQLYLGWNATDTGVYNMTGTLQSNWIKVGANGMGDFRQPRGIVQSYILSVGHAGGSNGLYTLGGTANTTLSTAFTYIGQDGKGDFEQSGGTHNVSEELWLGGSSDVTDRFGQGTYNISGN